MRAGKQIFEKQEPVQQNVWGGLRADRMPTRLAVGSMITTVHLEADARQHASGACMVHAW